MLLVFVAVSAALLLLIGLTNAYLIDRETKDNVITIGEVSVSLNEEPFDPTETPVVVPGSLVGKAPRLINDGNQDEFVFLRIAVPKAQVTLLYEQTEGDNRKGTPRTDPAQQLQEIFRLIADPTSQAVTPVPDPDSGPSYDVQFTYHSGTSSAEGWVLLERDLSGEDEDVYTFGYNKRMSPGDETSTLFDTVQLKSFIDGEAIRRGEDVPEGEGALQTISVYYYGIQADYLPDIDPDADILDETALQTVLAIVKNKNGITNPAHAPAADP